MNKDKKIRESGNQDSKISGSCFTSNSQLSIINSHLKPPPIIGRTCAFDAKIYKNVDTIFAVSPCVVWNKKFYQFSDFSFQPPAFLIDLLEKILPILTLKNVIINRRYLWHKFRELRGRKGTKQSKILNYWIFDELDSCYFCFWLNILVLGRSGGYNMYYKKKNEEKHFIEATLFAVLR
jgi:hypothetical protein